MPLRRAGRRARPIPNSEDATYHLLALGRGETDAEDRLMPVVGAELRRIAAGLLRRERPGHTLQPTALVHEAWIRLIDHTRVARGDRQRFLGLAARAMRHVLIDHARSHRADKRGGGATKQELDESIFPSVNADDEGFQIAERALEVLAEEHERAALVVTLKVFGGLTIPEIAAEVKVAERTVKNDWALARERLGEILS